MDIVPSLNLQPYFGELDRELERFIDRYQRQKRPFVQFVQRAWRPNVDIFENAEMVVAVAELAGIAESDLQVSVQDQLLTIRGRRHHTSEQRAHQHHQLEIASGEFERTVVLPASVDAERTSANLRNGLLEICMPKLQAARIKVEVQRGS